MKRVLFLSMLCGCFSLSLSAQQSPSVNLANKIADRMKDTLGLSQGQRAQVLARNVQLFNQKKAVREQYQQRDSVAKYLQRVENTRDSLYKSILTQEQFDLYKQKKRSLVSNN